MLTLFPSLESRLGLTNAPAVVTQAETVLVVGEEEMETTHPPIRPTMRHIRTIRGVGQLPRTVSAVAVAEVGGVTEAATAATNWRVGVTAELLTGVAEAVVWGR